MPVGIGTPQVDGINNGDANWGPKVRADIDALNGQFALAAVNTYRPADSSGLSGITGMRTGDLALRQDTGITYRYNGSAWQPWDSDWVDEVRTIVGISGVLNPTGGGNGWVFNYSQKRFSAGKVKIRLQLYLVGSSVAVTEQIKITLPQAIGSNGPHGFFNGRATKASSSTNYFLTGVAGGSTLYTEFPNAGIDTQTTYNVPFTWGQNDILAVAFEYDPS